MSSDLHREDDAIASYRQALSLSPHHSEAMFNRGLNELRLGRFRLGWEEIMSCAGLKAFAIPSAIPAATLERRALDGPLLISGEQGLGDQILHASMLPDALSRTR